MTKDHSKLDPLMRQRLLRESRAPWRVFRSVLWLALLGSATLGIGIMSLRTFAGFEVPFKDWGVQVSAVLVFGGLLWIERAKDN